MTQHFTPIRLISIKFLVQPGNTRWCWLAIFLMAFVLTNWTTVHAQTFKLDNGANLKILNNGLLDLGYFTTLQEENEGKITDGSVKGTRTSVNQPTNFNFAGLGAILTTPEDLGETVIIRTHDIQNVNGQQSINRYYDIFPTHNDGLNATLGFSYFDSELNGLPENDLTLFRSQDGGTTYELMGHIHLDAVNNVVSQNHIEAFSRWILANGLAIEMRPPNCAAYISPSINSDGELNVQLLDVVNQAIPLPVYDVEVINPWGGLITRLQGLRNTDYIFEQIDLCNYRGQTLHIRISNEEGTCATNILIPTETTVQLNSAFGNSATLEQFGIPTGRITDGKLVTYCGYVPDPELHRPEVNVSCGGSYYHLTAQPDWIMPVPCSEDSDTSEIIFRTWEVFNKDGDLFTLTDTIVVLRLPQLTSANFVGYSEDSVYCELTPNLVSGEAEKRYASWKQPVGLHDYELVNTKLRGVVYEIPLTIIIAGYEAAQAQGPLVVDEYLSCVILRKADGQEVTIADIISGNYLSDLVGKVSAEQRGYGFLHAIYQLGESPVSILGGLFTFFPYLLLEEGDWVLSEGGYFEQVTSDWFYTGHGTAPYWFAGGWPFITGTGGAEWYSDGHLVGASGCAVRVLVPALEDGAEACVEICLDDLDGQAHCGISIDYDDTVWSGSCPQTHGRDITVSQSCWGTTVNECVSDSWIQTEGGEGFVVVEENITGKMRTFTLSQWRNVFDTIGPIFDFYYPLGECEVNGSPGPVGPIGPQALPLPGGVAEDCGDLVWCDEDIAASIQAGEQYASANAWERCHPTVYRVSSHACEAEVFVPDVQLIDNCSDIHSVKAMVDLAGGSRSVAMVQTGVDHRIGSNGDTIYIYTYSHVSNPIRIPFNGCDAPLTEVRYEAADHCWNQSEWYKYIRIIDDVPPTVVVDREVNLSLGSETEWVEATTFDEGSWDNCALDLMLARRSDWTSLVDLCADVESPYDNWVDLLDDLGISRHHAMQAVNGQAVGSVALEAGFKIDDLGLLLNEGQIETYYFHQLVWLWEDGEYCGRKVVHGWLYALASYLAENCSVADDHGNTLDVRELEYIFDYLFDQPGYGNELSLLGGGWAKAVPFSCEDACLQTTAELLVMDACCNWGIGWSNVYVEDKSHPTVLKPLEDLEVSCEAYNGYYRDVVEAAAALGERGSTVDTSGIFAQLDALFGTYSTAISDLEFDYYNITCSEISVVEKIADTLHDGTIDWIEVVTKTTVLDTALETSMDGIIEFVCNGEVVQDLWLDLDECPSAGSGTVGTITRRFFLTSGCSSTADTLLVSQVIEIRSACALRKSMFDLPADFGSRTAPVCLPAPLSRSFFPDGLGSVQVKPHLFGVLCNIITIGNDIKELDVQGQPGLKKYEIVWRMRDWCADVPVDLTHTQVVIARIDGSCEFDGGETSGSPVTGVLERGERIHRDGFTLYQNHPNPFEGYTVIGFDLPEAAAGRLLIYEVTGKVVKEIQGEFVKGYNEVTLTRDELSSAGMLYYQLETDRFVATKKMVIKP